MMKLNHIGLLAKDCEEAVKHINEILGELNILTISFRRKQYL